MADPEGGGRRRPSLPRKRERKRERGGEREWQRQRETERERSTVPHLVNTTSFRLMKFTRKSLPFQQIVIFAHLTGTLLTFYIWEESLYKSLKCFKVAAWKASVIMKTRQNPHLPLPNSVPTPNTKSWIRPW